MVSLGCNELRALNFLRKSFRRIAWPIHLQYKGVAPNNAASSMLTFLLYVIIILVIIIVAIVIGIIIGGGSHAFILSLSLYALLLLSSSLSLLLFLSFIVGFPLQLRTCFTACDANT